MSLRHSPARIIFSKSEAIAHGVACAAVLCTIVIWLGEVWAQGIFGGVGTAFLTPFISIGLGVIALKRRSSCSLDLFQTHNYGFHNGIAVTSVLVLMSFGISSNWMFVVAVFWPIWVLVLIVGTVGLDSAQKLTFPILFLWFCLPFEPYLYDALDGPLQASTTDIAVWLLGVFGYPVQYWNEYTFYTSDFYIIVDETCSGMNMIIALTMYALIFGWVTRHRILNRLLLVSCVLPLALLSNGMRVAAIYLLGLYGGEELATGFWHDGSGVVAFMPTLLGIYAAGELLRWFERRRKINGSDASKTRLNTG